jgi:hypothetical protein
MTLLAHPLTVPYPIPPSPSSRGCPHPSPIPTGLPTPLSLNSLNGQVHLLLLKQALLYVASVCCLVGGTMSERSQGSWLVKTAGLPMGPPSSLASCSLSLIQPQASPTSVPSCLSQLLVGPLKGQDARLLSVSTP